MTTNNIARHIGSASCNPNKPSIIKDRSTRCDFCGRDFSTYNGKCQHIKRCVLNPNYEPKTMPNDKPVWNKGKTSSNDLRIQKQVKTRKDRLADGTIKPVKIVWSEESKLKQSERMSAIARTSESYSGRYNRGHVKEKTCTNGMKVIGSWEALFVEYCIDNSIIIEQPKTPYTYVYKGKERVYYPDFYLPEKSIYIEIKGYTTERDLAKWDAMRNEHKKELRVLQRREINLIRTGNFKIDNG